MLRRTPGEFRDPGRADGAGFDQNGVPVRSFQGAIRTEPYVAGCGIIREHADHDRGPCAASAGVDPTWAPALAGASAFAAERL
jgi:hypothetical protein